MSEPTLQEIKQLREGGCIDNGLTVFETIQKLQAMVATDPEMAYAVLYTPGKPVTEISSGQGLEVYLR